MTKLGQDLKKGDRLSLTGWEIVRRPKKRGSEVRVQLENGKFKVFEAKQIVHLSS